MFWSLLLEIPCNINPPCHQIQLKPFGNKSKSLYLSYPFLFKRNVSEKFRNLQFYEINKIISNAIFICARRPSEQSSYGKENWLI